MLTLYSYPELFGVADNNAYGLKVFAFLRLAGVPFRHEHIFDASSAPRGQIRWSAGGEWDNHRDRTRRIGLRPRNPRHRRQRGSAPATKVNTTGTVRVACCNAAAAMVPELRMTSGANPTNSAAYLRVLSALSADQRVST
jgi:hypothetical protein